MKMMMSLRAINFPTMEDIFATAKCKGVNLEVKAFGPSFKVVATNIEHRQIGVANGFIRLWWPQPILHLDSVRLNKEGLSIVERSLFGVGILIGAAAVRHGYDSGCHKAELLAINDTDFYHSKLVKYYKRLGFTPVCEVRGDDFLRDLSHLLVWGGVGTRMDACISELLVKWAFYFKSEHEPEHGKLEFK